MGVLPATEELIKQADEDLEAFRAKVKKTKRRRAVPQGSTPIESTHICLLPNYRIKRRSDALADTKERAQYVIDKTASDEQKRRHRATAQTQRWQSHDESRDRQRR